MASAIYIYIAVCGREAARIYDMMTALPVLYPRVFPHVSWKTCTQFPALRASKSCYYPGLMVEVGVNTANISLQIITMLADNMNLTIEPHVIVEDDNDITRTPFMINGTPHSGYLKLLYSGTVDVVAGGFQETNQRGEKFEFSEKLYSTYTAIVIHEQLIMSDNIWGFLRTNNANTWYTMLVALALQITLCVIIRQVECAMTEQNEPVGIVESAWQMLRLQLMQPEKIHFYSCAGRISITIFSFVQCAVLLGVFSSWILSSIIADASDYTAIEGLGHLINSIEQKTRVMVSSAPNTWFFEEIKESQTYPYKQFRKALKSNPLRLVNRSKDALDVVINEGAVTFVQSDDDTYFMASKYCKLQLLTEDMPIVTSRLMFRKGYPLAGLFNKTIKENKVHLGRIIRKYDNYYAKISSSATCHKHGLHSPLELTPYLGLLIICTGLHFLATGVLLVELMQKRKRK